MPPMEGPRDRIVKNLNEKLASVLLDCHAKEDLVTKNVKMAPEANAGDLLLSFLLLFSSVQKASLKYHSISGKHFLICLNVHFVLSMI